MTWLGFSLLAALLWTGVSVVDKVVIEKYIPNALTFSFFMSSYGLISASLFAVFFSIHLAPLIHIMLATVSGTLYLVYIVLYFASLAYSDASVVVALGQITPIFATLWGFVFLKERFEWWAYGGIVLIIFGAIGLSLESNQATDGKVKTVQLNKALQFMILACFVRSLSDLLLKSALEKVSVADGFFWPRIGIFAGACVPLGFAFVRKRLWLTIKQIGIRANLLIMGSEGAALLGTGAFTLAYAMGPLTLVSASSSVQPLLIVLLVWLLNWLHPNTIPDNTDRRSFLIRVLPFLMTIIGVYLLQV